MTIDWKNIDTVLLDMDGTILDRHFDDHFWCDHVPMRWAAQKSTTIEYARDHLFSLFKSQENTLNWTDLDYWSNQLQMDIPLMKLEVEHLIAVHPYVIDFLLFLKKTGKKVWLVTNAHTKTLDLKMNATRISHFFDGAICAHQVGLPKEDDRFWEELQRFIPFEPSHTMLGEDSEINLGTAERYGIKYLVYVGRFSSVVPTRKSKNFASIEFFSSLIPANGELSVTI
ncbi:MAG: HAD family hydrolase [Deltaproteobacteria bacterium]